jgi:RNA polymerase sigma-70 factor (ECF subfamily)
VAPPAPPGAEGKPALRDEAPDAQLVGQALAGEAAAFGQLYDRHVDRVYRFMSLRLPDAALATDLTQDVFVNALRHLPSLREADRFGSWLMQIAHNHVVNHLTRRGAAAMSLDDVSQAADEGGPLDAALVDAGDVSEAVARRLDSARLVAAARELTDDQQAVLALRFAGGLSVGETAAVLGKGEDAVKQLQHRAVVQLRRLLASPEAAP